MNKCMIHVYACTTSVVYIYSMYMIMVPVSIIVLSFVHDTTYKIMVKSMEKIYHAFCASAYL